MYVGDRSWLRIEFVLFNAPQLAVEFYKIVRQKEIMEPSFSFFNMFHSPTTNLNFQAAASLLSSLLMIPEIGTRFLFCTSL